LEEKSKKSKTKPLEWVCLAIVVSLTTHEIKQVIFFFVEEPNCPNFGQNKKETCFSTNHPGEFKKYFNRYLNISSLNSFALAEKKFF